VQKDKIFTQHAAFKDHMAANVQANSMINITHIVLVVGYRGIDKANLPRHSYSLVEI